MDFSKALDAMKAGKKVRLDDMNKGVYIKILDVPNDEHKFWIFDPTLKHPVKFYFSNGALLSEDWEIVPDIPEVQLRASEMFYCPNCLEPNHGPFLNSKNVECKECGLVVNLLHKDEPIPEPKQPEFVFTQSGHGYGLLYVPGINRIVKVWNLQQGIKYPETKEDALKILDELSTFRVPLSEISAFKGSVNAETSQSMRREWNLVCDQWLRFC